MTACTTSAATLEACQELTAALTDQARLDSATGITDSSMVSLHNTILWFSTISSEEGAEAA